MGFTEAEIRQRINEIIEFSELGEFIDKPVRTYSSGMFSKLAFAITAIMETDIMLIDEVLSVGDSRFKKKSYRKIKELISKEDRTVMIVSHNNETLMKLCTEMIWINEGDLIMQGDPQEVIEQYEAFMEENAPNELPKPKKK
jgi:ABC-type polysaccharide/polyol phosphate transport system ATPase subunit